jgi:uncharacterized protein YqfA (UPF0365 family)
VGTAFEILSIDIADVDVGENVGAKLQVAQAEANKNMAQAQAEIRRAAAVALEQEMKARFRRCRPRLSRPRRWCRSAMADAFRNGRLGVMDYYRMDNVQADTSMRQSIAETSAPAPGATGGPGSRAAIRAGPGHVRGCGGGRSHGPSR